MRDSIRVGIIQPKPYPSFDDPRNIGHALLVLERLRSENLDIVCFPELFPFQGDKELAGAARQCNSYVVAGLAEVEGTNLYNTATLFDRQGHILGRQRKRNLGVLERNSLGMAAGDGVFRCYATDFGKIGVTVGIDFWGQPEAGRQLVDQGADVIFNICMFPMLRGHWKAGAMVRAFDNFVPVVGVNAADYNALIQEKRVHLHGGRSFLMQPPRVLDKDDFQRWFKSLDQVQDWTQVELDELEQTQIVEVNLGPGRKFRKEFWNRLGGAAPLRVPR